MRNFRKFISQPAISQPLIIFLVARLLLSALGLALWAIGVVPTTPSPIRPYHEMEPVVEGAAAWLLGVWQRFDVIHYTRIAAFGYHDVQLTVFYPLFPLLIRLAAPLAGGDALLAALVVSNLACLLALIVFYQLLADEQFEAGDSRRALMYLLMFPAGFFLLVPYTESLFLLLSLLCFREARRGRWAWAALAGLAASLTRFQGVALTAMLGLEILRQAQWKPLKAGWRLAFALAPVVGVAAFWGWRAWAGFPPLTELQSGIWRRAPALPWEGIILNVQRIIAGQARLIEYIDLPATLLMLGLGVVVLRRLPPGYGLYFWIVLLFNLSQYRVGDPLSGQARFALTLFPAFMALARVGRPAWLNRVILYLFTGLWFFTAGAFVLWGFVG